MRKSLWLLFCLALAACGPNGPRIYAMTIVDTNGRYLTNEAFVVVKGKEAVLRAVGKGDFGDDISIENGDLTWDPEQRGILKVERRGDQGVITGLADWFDEVKPGDPFYQGLEPESTLTVRYLNPDGSAFMRLLYGWSLLNAEGRWTVTADAAFPMTIVQYGRIFDSADADASGHIYGYSVAFWIGARTYTGVFTSRTSMRGEYSDDGGARSAWTAEKSP